MKYSLEKIAQMIHVKLTQAPTQVRKQNICKHKYWPFPVAASPSSEETTVGASSILSQVIFACFTIDVLL